MGRLNYTTEEVNTILDNASRPAPPTPAKVSSGGDTLAKAYFHRKVMPVNAEVGVTYFTHQIRIKSNLTADDFPLRIYVDELPISEELLKELRASSLHICQHTAGIYPDGYVVTLSEGEEYFDVEFVGDASYDVVLSFGRGYFTKNKSGIIEYSLSTIKEEFPKNKYPTEYLRCLLFKFLTGDDSYTIGINFEIQVLRRSRHRKGKWTGDYTQMPCASYKSYRWTTSLSRLSEKLPVMRGPLIVRCRINRRCEWGYFFIIKRRLTGWRVYKLHKRDTFRREMILINKANQ